MSTGIRKSYGCICLWACRQADMDISHSMRMGGSWSLMHILECRTAAPPKSVGWIASITVQKNLRNTKNNVTEGNSPLVSAERNHEWQTLTKSKMTQARTGSECNGRSLDDKSGQESREEIVAKYRIPKEPSNSFVVGVEGSLGSDTKFSSSLPAHINKIDAIPTKEGFVSTPPPIHPQT